MFEGTKNKIKVFGSKTGKWLGKSLGPVGTILMTTDAAASYQKAKKLSQQAETNIPGTTDAFLSAETKSEQAIADMNAVGVGSGVLSMIPNPITRTAGTTGELAAVAASEYARNITAQHEQKFAELDEQQKQAQNAQDEKITALIGHELCENRKKMLLNGSTVAERSHFHEQCLTYFRQNNITPSTKDIQSIFIFPNPEEQDTFWNKHPNFKPIICGTKQHKLSPIIPQTTGNSFSQTHTLEKFGSILSGIGTFALMQKCLVKQGEKGFWADTKRWVIAPVLGIGACILTLAGIKGIRAHLIQKAKKSEKAVAGHSTFSAVPQKTPTLPQQATPSSANALHKLNESKSSITPQTQERQP